MKKPLAIFIIYAHEDRLYKDELIKALSPLKRQGWVKSWHDGDIQPGEVWGERIRENLHNADLVLPLVSSDFFASEYIQQVEIESAFRRFAEGQCAVVPVIIRACEWQADARLARLQALPANGLPVGSWGKPDEAYSDIAAGVRKLVESPQQDIAAETAAPESQVEALNGLPIKNKPSFWKKSLPFFKRLEVIVTFIAALSGIIAFLSNPGCEPEKMSEGEALELAEKTGNIRGWRHFAKEYPDGLPADTAKEQIRLLQLKFDSCIASARALYKGGEADEAYLAVKHAMLIHPDTAMYSQIIFNDIQK